MLQATFTKRNYNSDHLAALLQQLITQGDNYEQVTIKIKALPDNKQDSICEKLIDHFVHGATCLEKMIPRIQFQFNPPYPQWSNNLMKMIASSQSQTNSSANSSSANGCHNTNRMVIEPPPEIQDMYGKLRNQRSGEGFLLWINMSAQQDILMLSIQKAEGRPETKSSGMLMVLMRNSVANNAFTLHVEEENDEEEVVIEAKRPRLRPRKFLPSPTTRVGDLPAGLLGRALLQHLPWRKRLEVEGVCRRWQRESLTHGWGDVQRLSWGDRNQEIFLSPASWQPLLTRAGRHLTTLSLANAQRKELNVAELCAGLAKLPKLRQLCIQRWHLTQRSLNLIHRELATRLRCLRLKVGGMKVGEMFDEALHELLNRLPALEYLHIGAVWSYRSNIILSGEKKVEGFRFPTASLAGNLRHLSLHNCGHIFSEASMEELASLTLLRSLSISSVAVTSSLPDLRNFTQLQHLDIECDGDKLQSLVRVLPHLGGSLKALRVCLQQLVSGLHQLIPAISTHLPLLEHLGVSAMSQIQQQQYSVEQTGEMLQLIGALKNLKSLAMSGLLWSLEKSWAWLEEVCHQLEYLELGGSTPLPTICNIVKLSRNLRALKLTQQLYSASVWELVDAPSSIESDSCGEKREGGGESQSPKKSGYGDGGSLPSQPILRIAFCGSERMLAAGCSRLQFVPLETVYSHVLHKYRYGCLSGGRTGFRDDE